MRCVILIVTALALLLGFSKPQENSAVNELARLQGNWNFVSLEAEGMKFPAQMFKGAKIIIKGDTFTSITREATYSGTVKVDTTKKPKTIDLIFTEGPEKGKTSLGIYDLDGDSLKICLGLAGRDRPEEYV